MNKIRIFLASSSELKEDRIGFEVFINRKNKELINQNIFLELIVWEDFLDAVSKTRLQDEYNKAVKASDIFLMLFCTKVGKYTEEEFENAFEQFRSTNKPFIFTYFKNVAIASGELNDDILDLLNFKKKLAALGHYYTSYKSIEDLNYQFGAQLSKLQEQAFIKFEPAEAEQPNVKTNVVQTHSGSGDNVAGDKIINNK